MLLAATEKEIGSVIIWSVTLAINADATLRKELKIPDGFQSRASIVLGYPAIKDDTKKDMSLRIATSRI